MWKSELLSVADEFESLGSAVRESAVPTFTRAGLRDWLRGLSIEQGVLMLAVLASVLVTFGVPSLWQGGRFNPTPEGRLYDTLFLLALYIYLFLYLEAFCLLRQAWLRLRRLLTTLDSLPFQAALREASGTGMRGVRTLHRGRLGVGPA